MVKPKKQFYYFKLDALRKLCVCMGLISAQGINQRIIKYHGTEYVLLALIVLCNPKSTDINKLAASYIMEIFWPDWKKEFDLGVVGETVKRNDKEVYLWRKMILERDNYQCVKCGSFNHPEAHHIIRWVDVPSLRIIVDNGTTLCKKCHNREHGKEYYGGRD